MKLKNTVETAVVHTDDEIKEKLDEAVKALHELRVQMKLTVEKMCRICYETAQFCGENVAAKRIESEFSVVKRIGFKYFMLAGEGKTWPEITGVQVAEWRECIVGLPLDVQEKLFTGGLEVVDYVSEKVVKTDYHLDKMQWQTLWDKKTGTFRSNEEQLAWIHHCKEAEKKARRYIVKANGFVQIPKRCTLTLDDMRDIFAKIKSKLGNDFP